MVNKFIKVIVPNEVNLDKVVKIIFISIFIAWQFYADYKLETYVHMKEKEKDAAVEGSKMIQRNKLELTLLRLTHEYQSATETIRMLEVQRKQIEAATEEVRYKLESLGFAEEVAEPIHVDRNLNRKLDNNERKKEPVPR